MADYDYNARLAALLGAAASLAAEGKRNPAMAVAEALKLEELIKAHLERDRLKSEES